MPETSQYMTTREVAALMRVKERKIYDLVAKGDIPVSKTTGKLLFPKDAVLAWIAKDSPPADKTADTAASAHETSVLQKKCTSASCRSGDVFFPRSVSALTATSSPVLRSVAR